MYCLITDLCNNIFKHILYKGFVLLEKIYYAMTVIVIVHGSTNCYRDFYVIPNATNGPRYLLISVTKSHFLFYQIVHGSTNCPRYLCVILICDS